MNVVHLARKPGKDLPMEPLGELSFRDGIGIDGDANADPCAARQVLIAGAPALAAMRLRPGDLRENIVLDTSVEHLPSGSVLAVGTAVRLLVTIPCEPCWKLNCVRPSLAGEAQGRRGVLARVLSGGTVRIGDRAVVETVSLRPLPLPYPERFHDFLRRIPAGKVATYMDAVTTLGFPSSSFARVLPRYLKTAPEGAPVHRMVRGDLGLIEEHVPGQAALLAAEGTLIEDGRVAESARWDSAGYFA